MNYRSVVNILGFILILLGISMVFSIGWTLYYHDDIHYYRDLKALLKSMFITLLSGTILVFLIIVPISRIPFE